MFVLCVTPHQTEVRHPTETWENLICLQDSCLQDQMWFSLLFAFCLWQKALFGKRGNTSEQNKNNVLICMSERIKANSLDEKVTHRSWYIFILYFNHIQKLSTADRLESICHLHQSERKKYLETLQLCVWFLLKL